MILRSLDRYRDFGLLFLRLGMGVMMMVHGFPKITGGPEAWASPSLGGAIGALGVPVFLPAFWGFMAAVAEFVGGLALIFGFFHRLALFLLICTMIVAVAVHASKGENYFHPLELGLVFVGMFIAGPGKFSMDDCFMRKKLPSDQETK